MQLKICGLRDLKNVQEVVENASPDLVGFIFYTKSSRNVDETKLPGIIEKLPANVKKVGVFVNATTSDMLEKAIRYKLDYLQLHGEESVAQCRELYDSGQKIIKAFGIRQQFDFGQLQSYVPYISYFLFDTKGEKEGGNGYSFDWKVLNDYDQKVPFFLSGGISLENIDEVKEFRNLNIFGLDVNSKFEVSPGLKDIFKMKALRNKIDDLKIKI